MKLDSYSFLAKTPCREEVSSRFQCSCGSLMVTSNNPTPHKPNPEKMSITVSLGKISLSRQTFWIEHTFGKPFFLGTPFFFNNNSFLDALLPRVPFFIYSQFHTKPPPPFFGPNLNRVFSLSCPFFSSLARNKKAREKNASKSKARKSRKKTRKKRSFCHTFELC